MKKVFLVLLVVFILVLGGCKKKEEGTIISNDIEDYVPESLNKLVSYEVLDNYEFCEDIYWNDDSDILNIG